MKENSSSFYEVKEDYFKRHKSIKARKKWYYHNYENFKIIVKINHFCNALKRPKLTLHFDFARWYLIDLLQGKQRKFWGIYQFVALPGEGKTMSMVAHAERVRSSYPDVVIGANFGYVHATHRIAHWEDIIEIAMYSHKRNLPCLILMDEIHITFDSSDWKSFPPELLALLSFNRKFKLQFLCTSQIYERIPKKIRDIANYTVVCKNVLGADRLFKCWYYAKDDYESTFDGKRKSAKFLREFIADDYFYSLYNTLEQVDQLKKDAISEKMSREKAFDVLFGKENPGEPEENL